MPDDSSSRCCEKTKIRTVILLCLVLIAVTLSVYMQTGNQPFLNLDDDVYIANNSHVAKGLTGDNVVYAFTSP